MSLGFWIVAIAIGVVGLVWVKVRRRRKGTNAGNGADIANAA
jgi:hypothetical protein